MIKMEVEREKIEEQTNESEPEMFLSELAAMSWSVVSFSQREAGNLTYEQAEAKIQELAACKISGLCIITDDAAERMKQ